jgi:hypothetical protein
MKAAITANPTPDNATPAPGRQIRPNTSRSGMRGPAIRGCAGYRSAIRQAMIGVAATNSASRAKPLF